MTTQSYPPSYLPERMPQFTQKKWYLVSPLSNGNWNSVLGEWGVADSVLDPKIYRLGIDTTQDDIPLLQYTNDWVEINTNSDPNNTDKYLNSVAYLVYATNPKSVLTTPVSVNHNSFNDPENPDVYTRYQYNVPSFTQAQMYYVSPMVDGTWSEVVAGWGVEESVFNPTVWKQTYNPTTRNIRSNQNSSWIKIDVTLEETQKYYSSQGYFVKVENPVTPDSLDPSYNTTETTRGLLYNRNPYHLYIDNSANGVTRSHYPLKLTDTNDQNLSINTVWEPLKAIPHSSRIGVLPTKFYTVGIRWDGYQVLLKGLGNQYKDKYYVITTDMDGKEVSNFGLISSGANWRTGHEMAVLGYENRFNLDLDGDSQIGSYTTIEEYTTFIISGLAEIGSGDKGVILPTDYINLTEQSVTHTNLVSLRDYTIRPVKLLPTCLISGTLNNLTSLYTYSWLTDPSSNNLRLTNTLLVNSDISTLINLDLSTTGLIDATSVSTLDANITDALTLYDSSGNISGLADISITLTDQSTSDVSGIILLDNMTGGVVDVSGIITISNLLEDLVTLLPLEGISGLESMDYVLTDTSINNISALNTLDLSTTGTIDASGVTLFTGLLSPVVALYDSQSVTGLDATNYAITDTNINVDTLALLDNATTGDVDTSDVTIITGLLLTILTLYGSSVGISGLEAMDFVLTDVSLNSTTGLNTLYNSTTGTVDASSINTITEDVVSILTLYDQSENIIGLGGVNIVLTDTTLTDIKVLTDLDSHTSGTINAGSVNFMTGLLASLLALYDSQGINEIGATNFILTDTSINNINTLNSLDLSTTGSIDASGVTLITGLLASSIALYDSLSVIEIDDMNYKITDPDINVDNLNILNNNTTGDIDIGSVTVITGLLVTLLTLYGSLSGISGLEAMDYLLTDTTLDDTAGLTALDLSTNGTIDASSINTITEDATSILTLYDPSFNIIGLGGVDIVLTDTTLTDITVLTGLDHFTTGTIDASGVTVISGPLDTTLTLYDSSSGIIGLEATDYILTDISLNENDISGLNSLDLSTNGTIDASEVTLITGLLGSTLTLYDLSGGISGLGATDVVLTDSIINNIDNLNLLDLSTTGTIDASGVTNITGPVNTLLQLYNSPGISGLEAMNYIITDTSLNDINGLITLNNNTTGTIDASSIPTITASVDNALNLYGTESSITGLDGLDIILTDEIVSDASLLNSLDNFTEGIIYASSVTSLSGTPEAISVAVTSDGIIGLIHFPPGGGYPPNMIVIDNPPIGTYPPDLIVIDKPPLGKYPPNI